MIKILDNCTKLETIDEAEKNLKCKECHKNYWNIDGVCKRRCNPNPTCPIGIARCAKKQLRCFYHTICITGRFIGGRSDRSYCEMPPADNKINGCATYKPIEWNNEDTFKNKKLNCKMCRMWWEPKDSGARCELRPGKHRLRD